MTEWIKIIEGDASTLPEPIFHQGGEMCGAENRVRVWATWSDEEDKERYWWERYAYCVQDTTDDGDSEPYFMPCEMGDDLVTVTHWQPLAEPPKS